MRGNLIRFEDLYETWADPVYRFALRLSGDPALAEDIVAETFLRVWTASERVRIDTVRAYLFAIARNLFLHGLRRRQRHVPLDDAPELSVRQPDAEARERAEQVSAAIRALAEPDRSALLLRVEEELSYDEVAQVLGISPEAARVKVHRARLRVAAACAAKEICK